MNTEKINEELARTYAKIERLQRKAKDLEERTELISYLKENGIYAVFHYIPLHTAPAGVKFGRFHGEDRYTTKESERLLRLPMYYGLTLEQVDYICDKVYAFFENRE